MTLISTLESLPDEVWTHLFGYLSTSDLCQSFYNLNTRLNNVFESLENLHLTITEDKHVEHLSLFFSRVYSLITIGEIEIDLNQFKHVHRLTLCYPTKKLLQQLDHGVLRQLEYLSIPDVLYDMSFVYQKIFSNAFPRLTTLQSLGFETIETIGRWTQLTSLRSLKIGSIDFHVYKAILAACPALHDFKLRMFQSYLKLSHVQVHFNLRQLEIESDIADCRYNDQLTDMFLAGVPNLEELTVFRSLSITKMIDLIPDYDWLASIIAIRLPRLRYLSFYLHLELHLEFLDFISTDTRRQLRRFFLNAHQSRYQARFIIQ
jgi:hypothetical protein